ncbi:hypothetical protein CP532_1176 [Ophiocordyceps camponoti-leonardi (nom. inval.)]|nr:hypothetical protein CP532_1176 [Ophiocordyceps camponoti-leonardi (nom. inval.)]
MSLKSCVLLLGGYSVLAAGVAVPQNEPASKTCNYTVKSGENCNIIALNHGIDVPQLRKLNPTLNSDCFIRPDNVLNVPCVEQGQQPEQQQQPVKVKPTGECKKHYKVEELDNWRSIVSNQGVSKKNLRLWNDLDAACTLTPGKELCISYADPIECANFHTVVSGDTCLKIAEKNNKSLLDLVELNPSLLDDECFLDVGYKVCVKPVNDSDPDAPVFEFGKGNASEDVAPTAGSVTSDAAAASTAVDATSITSDATTSTTSDASTSTTSDASTSTTSDATTTTPITPTSVPMVTANTMPHFQNKTTSSFVTFTTAKTDASPSAPSEPAVIFPPNVNINISQDIKIQIRWYMRRYVGNETGERPIPDSVLLPSESRMQEMVKVAAQAKAEANGQGVAPTTGDKAVSPAPASRAPRSAVSRYIINLCASSNVSIQNSGCGTGACSVQVSSKAEAGISSSPASSAPSTGNGPVAPSVNRISASASADAKVQLGQAGQIDEADEDLEACEAE